MNILLSNVHHCSQMYIFGHFLTFFKTSNFRKHAKFAAKWTFCSQIRNMKPPAAKLRIVYYQHINQNTLPLVAVTRNNTASIIKTLSNFKHQNLLNVVVLVRFWEEPLWTLFLSSFFLSFFSHFRYIVLTFVWHFLTFFSKRTQI